MVHLPLLFLCGSDMWGHGGLGLLRYHREEVNAIKIEDRGGNKSSPNRNSERQATPEGGRLSLRGFGIGIFLQRTTVTGERECPLASMTLAISPHPLGRVRGRNGEDASRGFMFLFRPPGLATTADEAGAMVALYTQIPIECEATHAEVCICTARLHKSIVLIPCGPPN